jgi:hypothetical protein
MQYFNSNINVTSPSYVIGYYLIKNVLL